LGWGWYKLFAPRGQKKQQLKKSKRSNNISQALLKQQ
jgi:hypothetical protein